MDGTREWAERIQRKLADSYRAYDPDLPSERRELLERELSSYRAEVVKQERLKVARELDEAGYLRLAVAIRKELGEQ